MGRYLLSLHPACERAPLMTPSNASSALWKLFAILYFLTVASCASPAPFVQDDKFAIVSHGDFSEAEIRRVRKELGKGLEALEENRIPIRRDKFPIIVNLRSGPGVSVSYHGRGPIELYWVHEGRAPIIHELTHILAGYTFANGHWTPEGLASYMQDRYGEDRAFPSRGISHALTKVIIEEDVFLPMTEVMADRRREGYFGKGSTWNRWLAYTQSTSLCQYLIERYGMERFLQIYDRPVEAMDFPRIYGKSGEALVREWKNFLMNYEKDTGKARRTFLGIRTRTATR